MRRLLLIDFVSIILMSGDGDRQGGTTGNGKSCQGQGWSPLVCLHSTKQEATNWRGRQNAAPIKFDSKQFAAAFSAVVFGLR